jgi:hypothetical protein
MFAVIVLGIGFIMIAAIFPVAISQTQASLADTAGTTVGRTGSIYMANLIGQGTGTLGMGDVTTYANVGTVATPGGDGLVHPIDGPVPPDALALAPMAAPTRWDRLKGNFIETADPRFAWIPIGYKMYDERVGSLGNKSIARFAEFYILAVQAQVSPTFDRRDYDPPSTPQAAPFDVANLRPKLITGVVIEDNNPTYGVDTATFPPFADDQHTPIAPGAYILISNDNRATHELNGQYYRLGANIAPNIWELQPGGDYQPIKDASGVVIPTPITVDVLTVGRGFDDPAAPTQYQGAAMDLFMLPPVIVQLPIPPGP